MAPVKTEQVARINPTLPTPPALVDMSTWRVLSHQEIVNGVRPIDAQLAERLAVHFTRNPSAQFVVYAITPEDYAILVNNQIETLRYVQDLGAVIEYYRTVQ